MALTLGLTGDVMLGRLVDERQRTRPVHAVWDGMQDRLNSLQGLFVNLECCLSTGGRPWRRTARAFHFRADPDWAVPALSDAGVDGVTLANNHVLDFEVPALEDTLDALDGAGIARTGAGRDRDEALDPAVFEVGDLRVAAVGFTDNTPEYAASPDTPGTAWIEVDPDDEATRDAVTTALSRARAADPDCVIASLHWGPNMRTEPPDSFCRFARWLVDRGVDVVHGHSAHVFQGVEVYDGAPVCYDTGDFVDDYAVDDEKRNDRSFLFAVHLDPDTGRPSALCLEPTEITDCRVTPADAGAAAWSRERMRALSRPFGTEFERDGEALVTTL